MHTEAGYTYIGPTSIYKLTVPEMARLRHGFEVHERRKRDGDAAVETETGRDLERVDTPSLQTHGKQLRESDIRALDDFNARSN